MNATNPLRFRALIAAALTLAALGTLVPPASAQTADDAKRIAIRPAPPAPLALRIDLTPMKPTYRVGEPIRLRVRGNRPFHLYLYSIDRERDEVVLILPNRLQETSRYPADEDRLVPNGEVEFYADRPGTEKLVMVASSERIPLGTAYLTDAGPFLTGKASDLEGDLAAKGVPLDALPDAGDSVLHTTAEVVVRHLDLRIDPAPPAVATPDPETAPPIVFVSTDRQDYTRGERVHILFGANRPGWVHLYGNDPDGASDLLHSAEVNGHELYSLTARAAAPIGPQAVTAVYSPEPSPPAGYPGAVIEADPTAKALVLEPKPRADPPPTATRRFEIR